MSRILTLAVAAFVGAALASPALAFSVNNTPGAQGGAHLADPDEALSGAFKNLFGSVAPTTRQTPALRNAPVTYDLSKAGKSAKGQDGLTELSANPGDTRLNPFSGASSHDRSSQDQ